MSVYSGLSDGEIDAESPWTSAVTFKMRDNPLAIMEGDPTALSAGRGIYVDKGGQMALITDQSASNKVLNPIGGGAVAWQNPTSGSITNTTVHAIPTDLIEIASVGISTVGTYHVNVVATYRDDSDDSYDTHVGLCVVVDGSIAAQNTNSSTSTRSNRFTMSGSNIRWTAIPSVIYSGRILIVATKIS